MLLRQRALPHMECRPVVSESETRQRSTIWPCFRRYNESSKIQSKKTLVTVFNIFQTGVSSLKFRPNIEF